MPSKTLRPVDLARPYGLSAQAVRNYESQGVLPPAIRSPSGYRLYTPRHAAALAAYLALIPAHGYAVSTEIMRAVHAGDLDSGLRAIDLSHVQLLRDRETLDAVAGAVGLLAARPVAADGPARRVPISAVAHRLGVRPATLRKWERAGILVPAREHGTGHRTYAPEDVRDAELAHLLRRGGYLLAHIATVLQQVRAAGGAEPLAESLAAWRERLTARGRAMLTAATHLAAYLTFE